MRYFLSYVVIKGSNTNQFGHAYSVISQLDESGQSPVEVLDAIGFYGDPIDPDHWIQKKLLPAKLFGQGHLRQEYLRHIASTKAYVHEHRTWEITEQEKNDYLAGVTNDCGQPLLARNFAQENDKWQAFKKLKKENNHQSTTTLEQVAKAEEASFKAMKGGYFNIFKNTCMTDAKCRINKLGIKTPKMEGHWMDIPGLSSGPLLPMKLKMQDGQLVWKTPLVLTGRDNEDAQTRLWRSDLKQFYVLDTALDELMQKFEKFDETHTQVPPAIHIAQRQLQAIKQAMSPYVEKPLTLTAKINLTFERSIVDSLNQCRESLERGPSPVRSFVSSVIHWFKERIQELKVWLGLQQPDAFAFVHQQQDAFVEVREKLERKRAKVQN